MDACISIPPRHRPIQLHAVATFLGRFSLRTDGPHLPARRVDRPAPEHPTAELPAVSSRLCREHGWCAGDPVDDRRSRYSRPWHRQSGAPARPNRGYRHCRDKYTDRPAPSQYDSNSISKTLPQRQGFLNPTLLIYFRKMKTPATMNAQGFGPGNGPLLLRRKSARDYARNIIY